MRADYKPRGTMYVTTEKKPSVPALMELTACDSSAWK